MIYLTTDDFDNAVYFDLRKSEPKKRSGAIEHRIHGLIGNGIAEAPVEMTTWQGYRRMIFGKTDLFAFIDEKIVRKLLAELAQELTDGEEQARH